MIGIVGGVGPYAGKDLLEKIFDNTLAKSDQEHLDVALLSMSSQIEDRTAYLVDETKINPGIAIVEVLLKLEQIGATIAGIPCNTAHSERIFHVIQQGLEEAKSRIKLLNVITETGNFITTNFPNMSQVGVLSTNGTYQNGLYKKALEEIGLKVLRPTIEIQENFIHPAIYHPDYGIKSQSKPIHSQALKNILVGVSSLKEQGAQAVILGCTEISLAITSPQIEGMSTIDPTTVLARALIRQLVPHKLKPI